MRYKVALRQSEAAAELNKDAEIREVEVSV